MFCFGFLSLLQGVPIVENRGGCVPSHPLLEHLSCQMYSIVPLTWIKQQHIHWFYTFESYSFHIENEKWNVKAYGFCPRLSSWEKKEEAGEWDGIHTLLCICLHGHMCADVDAYFYTYNYVNVFVSVCVLVCAVQVLPVCRYNSDTALQDAFKLCVKQALTSRLQPKTWTPKQTLKIKTLRLWFSFYLQIAGSMRSLSFAITSQHQIPKGPI